MPVHVRPARGAGALALGASMLLTGCGSRQDVLRPASKQEHAISTLWWVMLGGAAIGFAVIAVLLFLGWACRNSLGLPFGGGERAATALVVGLGVALPIVILSALFVWSDVFVLKTTAAPNPTSTHLTVDVIGHQWYWEVRYPGTAAVTANEIHIPVRTRVNLIATTDDVIHSFWVPELNRKIDMIPGRTNRILLDADRVGTYRGQCSEFCGLQHAHMAFLVVADPPAVFQRWLATTAAPASTAAGPTSAAQVFVSQCGSCHAIRGTAAQGHVGPDLTHFGSRTTIGALTLPNTPGALAEWIRNPQSAKPGSLMPGLRLSQRDLGGLVAYLESLK